MSTVTHGFPHGYFVIKSIACNRVLDVAGDEVEDSTAVLLWPEKEKSLVETLRDPEANNQVFFIDTSGALCSRSSGHAIDVQDGKPVLRHRRPVSHPYPNHYAHPLPRFSYSSSTGEITVTFECDPKYPPASDRPSEAWKNKRYLLTSVPLRKPRTILDDASAFISSALASPLAFLSNVNADKRLARPDDVFDGEIELNEDEVVEEERGEEGEVDDSPDPGREVRIIGVPFNERDSALLPKARTRRTWKVLPLRRINARTGANT
ncbi:hypothetical protein AMATHDRAFT_74390 [Amanita thiersii Skay4041]|uniref:Uncharacterized protein n=1 Tax=Amanita thiersii Skay4041 TaxID=703135 RepID=A0A2A9NSN0_9AGAR|nr:hypothetical protein AMATHDRAFT_74390 [Amanita thiersii Skay4041]